MGGKIRPSLAPGDLLERGRQRPIGAIRIHGALVLRFRLEGIEPPDLHGSGERLDRKVRMGTAELRADPGSVLLHGTEGGLAPGHYEIPEDLQEARRLFLDHDEVQLQHTSRIRRTARDA